MSASARGRTLAAVIACIAVYGMTVGFSTPLLSLILEARGVSRTLIGLNAVMPAIALMLFSPFIPRLVRRMGLRRFLVTCLLADCALLLSLPVFDSLPAWFAIRFVMGATIGGLFVASETWINAIAGDDARGRIIALYNTVFYTMAAIGPALIPLTGTRGLFPFLVGGVIILAAGVPLRWATDGDRFMAGSTAAFGVGGFARAAPVLAATVALFALLDFTLSALLPVYGVRNGLTPGAAALTLTVLGLGRIALQLPIGWLADRGDRVRTLTGCVAASTFGLLLLPWAMNGTVTGALILFFWGGVVGGIYTLAMTLIGARFRGAELAVANAAVGVLWGIGGIVGPGAAGVAMDLWDPHGFVALLALACAATLAFTLARRSSGRDSRGQGRDYS